MYSKCMRVEEMFSENVSDLTLPVWPFQSITTHVHVNHVHTLTWKLVDQRGVYFIRAGASLYRLVRQLHALKCEQASGVWGHAPTGKIF